jgi:acetoacetyl-CoA reductase/3-oxoacyl-[acyl-carrier protein] reductase
MRANGWGRIINITSIGGQWGGMRQVHYAAAKAGLINLTHSLARLYSGDGITANAISPGLVATGMIGKELKSKAGKQKVAQIPAGRIARPEEIAAGIVYLASDAAAYVTGQTLNINGGMLMS